MASVIEVVMLAYRWTQIEVWSGLMALSSGATLERYGGVCLHKQGELWVWVSLLSGVCSVGDGGSFAWSEFKTRPDKHTGEKKPEHFTAYKTFAQIVTPSTNCRPVK